MTKEKYDEANVLLNKIYATKKTKSKMKDDFLGVETDPNAKEIMSIVYDALDVILDQYQTNFEKL